MASRLIIGIASLAYIAIAYGQICSDNSVIFQTDLTQDPTDWDHYWEKCVGSGHALLGLREDWRRHLIHAHDKCGFQMVRFHGLFDDDMSVYSLDSNNNTVYSFFNIDSIFDFLLSINMRPLVELSFMPEAMASGTDTIFHYNGNITPPKNFTDWYLLVQAVVQHLVDRYGIDEMRNWFFETWNEPNCGFWTGTQADYFHLLQVTSAAIKSVDSKIQVGGPATCQSGWLPDTLKFIKQNNVQLDFISTHEYPTDVNPTERSTLRQVMTTARAQVGDMPLYYTEYNDGLYGPGLHDTTYASAFAVFNIIDCYGIPDIMSWWTFTDIFEEDGLNSTPFQENYGMLTIYEVAKPSFRAFELLHETGDLRYDATSNNSTATSGILVTTNTTHLNILIYNHNVYGGAINTENLCIFVKGISTKGGQQATLRRIDSSNANAIESWINMGSPQYPTQQQIDVMKAASEMVHYPIIYTVVAAGEIMFQLSMPPESVAVITMALD